MSDDVAERAKVLARQIKLHQIERDELDEAIEDKKAALADLLGTAEGLTVGDRDSGYFKVDVYQGATFNEAFGKKARPDLWDKAKVTKETVTSASAKAVLTADEYALFQKPHDKTTVKVEFLTDGEDQ